jgi:glycosyltransferase involved in cell wall biosynthesis
MRRKLQRVHKAAQLARSAARIARSDGLLSSFVRGVRYVSSRSGLVTQQEFRAALAGIKSAQAAALAHQQQSVAALQAQLDDMRRRMALQIQVDDLQRGMNGLHEREAGISQSLRWLAEYFPQASQPTPTPTSGISGFSPLISIVMPVWNRRSFVGAAIDSVVGQTYGNWELLVVDDGSTDGSCDIISERLHDPRIRLLTREHRGVSQARNVALQEARGEIIAYLDSDNAWFPGYLAEVVNIFDACPEADCAYAAQLVDSRERDQSYIRSPRFDRDAYPRTGGIDLNVFAHRREMVDQFGDFDEELTQLVDWDLIVRYTRHRDPVVVPTIGGRYRAFGKDSISSSGNYAYNYYRLSRKHDRPAVDGLRVLYVVWDYPQLTETYIRWEIACLRRWGVHVEVWSELDKTASPYPSDVPVHFGSLEDAIRKVRPHLAHVHWLNIAERYHERIARAGLQMTVRGHGFEFYPDMLQRLLKNSGVQRINVFPHYVPPQADLRIRPMNSAFNGDLYYPPPEKDSFLVVRTASGKAAKSVETFIDVAAQCPQHRFVLALGVLNQLAHYAEEIQAYNRRLGSPVEIRVNVPTEEAAALVRQAGIYLHTYGTEEPFGMPISIAEAMATGAFTLVRNLPGASHYVGPVGGVYESVDEAANIIRQSARWYEEQWCDVRRRTVEFAYQHYADVNVLRPLLDDWLRIRQTGIDACSIVDELDDPDLRPALQFLTDEAGLGLISCFGRTYLSHVAGTSRILHGWGVDIDVRKAALFHSLYVDRRIKATPEQRAKIRALVGERAERLAYELCAVALVHIEPVLNAQPPFEFPDQIAGGTLCLSAADLDDLCRIHLAEWTEKRERCPEASLEPGFYRRIAQRLGGPAAEAFFANERTRIAVAGPQRRAA